MKAEVSCKGLKPIDAAFVALDNATPPPKRTREVVVGRADEIPVGGRKIVQIDRLSLGIFHLESGFHAIRNDCPHQGAELCKGSVHGTYRPGPTTEYVPAFPGRILRCPWHGWEFDIVTGKGLYDERGRVSIYEVRVNDAGDLIVVV
jgi:Ferredoxin subunits of nitrite reductase and ring-hydroxylating dioxygenases